MMTRTSSEQTRGRHRVHAACSPGMVWSTSSLALAGLLFSSAGAGCGTDDDCASRATCAVPSIDSGDSGVVDGGGDGQVPPPPGCDESADPKDAPKCVVNAYGVFVDGVGGADTNAGTKESPLKSVTAALGKLGGKPRVYVCGAGPYVERVKLPSGVSLYGGFGCGGWSYDGTKAKVSPSEPGYALHVENAPKAVVVSDLELVAKDAEGAGGSSIAVFVSRASQVTLRRTRVMAGTAQGGTDGSVMADFTPANAPDGTGGAGGGGATPNPACPTSIGGAGGKDGAVSGGAGQVAVTPEHPTGNTGAGGMSGGNCGVGIGTDGSYGGAGAPGAGAATVGTLDATGWKGAAGTAGGAGGHGQGGGGGAQRNAGGVGGSGGPGGCGGAGGANGTAGGSSIAVLAYESTLLVEESSLSAKDAGRGGNGAKGQKAQLMGNVGVKNGANACDGGFGGIGGSGGGGGGGAGGISAGILYKGNAPTIDGASAASADTHASVSVGAAGAGGGKGAGGDAAQTTAPASRAGQEGTAGADGAAKAVLSAP